MDLKDFIKKYRFEHNLTQTEFAEKVGVMQYVISNIENGKNKSISQNTISKIATATGKTEEEIVKMIKKGN